MNEWFKLNEWLNEWMNAGDGESERKNKWKRVCTKKD